MMGNLNSPSCIGDSFISNAYSNQSMRRSYQPKPCATINKLIFRKIIIREKFLPLAADRPSLRVSRSTELQVE